MKEQLSTAFLIGALLVWALACFGVSFWNASHPGEADVVQLLKMGLLGLIFLVASRF